MSHPLPPAPELLELAVRAAHLVAEDILAGFRNPSLHTELKADGTVVTSADKQAERRIRAFFANATEHLYPVLGEEEGDSTQGSRYRWTVDPIDGTLGYTRGLPNFGTLIAFDEAAVARSWVGVIHLPAFGETYAAARGGGAACNGTPVHVAPDRPLGECLICVASLRDFQRAGLDEGYLRLSREAGQLRGNFDCWTHGMAARGAVDAVIEFALNRWDIAPTQVIIEEGGGTCIIRPSRVTPGKFDAAFGNSRTVESLLKLTGF